MAAMVTVGSLRASPQDQVPTREESPRIAATDNAAAVGAVGESTQSEEATGTGVLDVLRIKGWSSTQRAPVTSTQSAAKRTTADYQTDFRQRRFDHETLVPFGFETLFGLQLLKPEAGGLRVIIPARQGDQKPVVGLLPLLKVQGDFEITASGELFATEPPTADLVAGFDLFILAEKSLNRALLRRGVRANGEQVYYIDCSIRGGDGKLQRRTEYFPAGARSAKLRLARAGEKLEFLITEGESEPFRRLFLTPFGTDNIGVVRLETTTDGSATSVESRWTDLTIRATKVQRVDVPLYFSMAADSRPARTRRGASERSSVDNQASLEITEQPKIRVFDDFEGGATLDWKAVRSDSAFMSFTRRDGMLTLTTHKGDLHANLQPLARNLYLIDHPLPDGGDFAVTTCLVSFHPWAPWQQAGLVLYDGDDQFLKWTFGFTGANKRALVLVHEENGVPDIAEVYPPLNADRLWLRLIKRGRFYDILSSEDGETFQSHGDFAWADGSPSRIGLMAMNGIVDVPQVDAHFDFFEVRSLRAGEKADPRQDERKQLWGIWRVVSARFDGKPLTLDAATRLTFVDESILRITEPGQSLQGEFTLDLTTQPHQLTLWKNRDLRTVVQRFAFKRTEDTLVISFNPDLEGPVPAALETNEGDGVMLLVLQRTESR